MDRKQQIDFCERAEDRHRANFAKRLEHPAYKAAMEKHAQEALKKPLPVRVAR